MRRPTSPAFCLPGGDHCASPAPGFRLTVVRAEATVRSLAKAVSESVTPAPSSGSSQTGNLGSAQHRGVRHVHTARRGDALGTRVCSFHSSFPSSAAVTRTLTWPLREKKGRNLGRWTPSRDVEVGASQARELLRSTRFGPGSEHQGGRGRRRGAFPGARGPARAQQQVLCLLDETTRTDQRRAPGWDANGRWDPRPQGPGDPGLSCCGPCSDPLGVDGGHSAARAHAIGTSGVAGAALSGGPCSWGGAITHAVTCALGWPARSPGLSAQF